MGEVVDLQERRERKHAEDHARALILFECASILARREHPGLVRLINEVFGEAEIELRVKATAIPKKKVSNEGRSSRR